MDPIGNIDDFVRAFGDPPNGARVYVGTLDELIEHLAERATQSEATRSKLLLNAFQRLQLDTHALIDFSGNVLQLCRAYPDSVKAFGFDPAGLRQFLGHLFDGLEQFSLAMEADDADAIKHRNEAISSLHIARSELGV
jgi:hypothetical protein